MDGRRNKRIDISNKSNYFYLKVAQLQPDFCLLVFFLPFVDNVFLQNISLPYYHQNSCSRLWLVFGVAKVSFGISLRLEVFEGKVGAARLQKMCLDEGSSVAVCWVILSLAAGEEDLLLKYSP